MSVRDRRRQRMSSEEASESRRPSGPKQSGSGAPLVSSSKNQIHTVYADSYYLKKFHWSMDNYARFPVCKSGPVRMKKYRGIFVADLEYRISNEPRG